MNANEIIEIYTEMTPNPESLKFVTTRHILPNFQLDFRTRELAGGSELATTLFESPFVNGVFIANNFVTITKKPEYDWYEISPELKDTLKTFLQSGKKPVDNSPFQRYSLKNKNLGAVETDPASWIIDLLESLR